GTRRREDVPNRCAVGEAVAHVPEEHGQVPGPAARRDRDLAGNRRVGADQRPRILSEPKLGRMGLDDAFKRLLDEVVGSVDQLLHHARTPLRYGTITSRAKRSVSTSWPCICCQTISST